MNIVVYSKDNCSQCDVVKMYLDMKSKSYLLKKLDVDFTTEQVKEQFPSVRSYPIVVIDDIYIGGYNELKEKIENKK